MEVDSIIVERFNKRDINAFGEVYRLFYTPLHKYASMLYANSEVDAEDAVHDSFVNLWKTQKYTFLTIGEIKAYMLVSIKNSYLRHIERTILHKKKCQELYNDKQFICDIAHAEIFSLLPELLQVLPSECAKVVKMILEGWEMKEIAQMLNKKESTIYNQKRAALTILKKKMKYILFVFIKK